MSNVFRAPMALRMARARVVPRTLGQMTWTKVRKLPAPSILADPRLGQEAKPEELKHRVELAVRRVDLPENWRRDGRGQHNGDEDDHLVDHGELHLRVQQYGEDQAECGLQHEGDD